MIKAIYNEVGSFLFIGMRTRKSGMKEFLVKARYFMSLPYSNDVYWCAQYRDNYDEKLYIRLPNGANVSMDYY